MLSELKGATILRNKTAFYESVMNGNQEVPLFERRLLAHFIHKETVKGDSVGFVSLTQLLYLCSQIDSLSGTSRVFALKNGMRNRYGMSWLADKSINHKVINTYKVLNQDTKVSRYNECLRVLSSALFHNVENKVQQANIRRYIYDLIGKNSGNSFLNAKDEVRRTYSNMYENWRIVMYHCITCDLGSLSSDLRALLVASSIVPDIDVFALDAIHLDSSILPKVREYVMCYSPDAGDVFIMVSGERFSLLMGTLIAFGDTESLRLKMTNACIAELFSCYEYTKSTVSVDAYRALQKFSNCRPLESTKDKEGSE